MCFQNERTTTSDSARQEALLQIYLKHESSERQKFKNFLQKLKADLAGPGHAVAFIDESQYTVDKSRRLGKGGLGEVFIGQYQGAEIAVKELLVEADAISEETKQSIEREASMMVGLRHPNVVQFLGIGARDYAILMEYMPNRSLFHLLQNGQPIAWEIIVQIAKDITSGLSYLHAKKIVHRDLKSLNVLLGRDLRAKLSDFGMAKVKQDTFSLKSSGGSCGTPAWTAPEVLCDEVSANYESDIYSLGMVFWELFAKKTPFAGMNPFTLAFKLSSGTREEIPSDTQEPFRAIITQCWKSADLRPKAVEIADMLKGIEIAEAAVSIAMPPARLSSSVLPASSMTRPAWSGEVKDRFSGKTSVTKEEAELTQLCTRMTEHEIKACRAEEELALLRAQVAESEIEALKEKKAHLDAERQLREQERLAPEIAIFLKLVAEGEQEQAEEALQRNSELALYPGKVTDLSGRTFHNITALQYAVWALDWQMWSMLLRYIDRENAGMQINAMATGSWISTHGATAERLIRNLLTELQVYSDNVDKWYKAKDYDSMEKQWSVKVGTAQRNLPVHVVNEYCHPKEAFDPLPDFKSATRYQPGWRTRITDEGEWFTAKYNGGSLGSNFSVGRGRKGEAVFGTGRVVFADVVTYYRPKRDTAAGMVC